MNADDLRLFDRYTVIKINARGWALIRQLAEMRRPTNSRHRMSNDVDGIRQAEGNAHA